MQSHRDFVEVIHTYTFCSCRYQTVYGSSLTLCFKFNPLWGETV